MKFLDRITILSFAIGAYALIIALQNLEENREQSEDSRKILDRLDDHLKQQDEHLHNQDKILLGRSGMIEGNI